MLEITLLRHAKVAGPAALYGQTDIAVQHDENNQLLTFLSQEYHLQQAADSALSPYDLVISSPLQRCWLLAQQFSQQCDIPLQCLDGFGEMDFGKLDGRPFDHLADSNVCQRQLKITAADNWRLLESFWHDPAQNTLPAAESLTAFNQRIIASWHELVSKQLTIQTSQQNQKTDKKRILLICHGGVIRMILSEILQLEWRNPIWYQCLQIANGSISRVTVPEQASLNSLVNFIALPLSASIHQQQVK